MSTIQRLSAAFNELRGMTDQGLLAYPYSTRELVNIVRHMSAFPADSMGDVMANVLDLAGHTSTGGDTTPQY